jgi:hypothetical protein
VITGTRRAVQSITGAFFPNESLSWMKLTDILTESL